MNRPNVDSPPAAAVTTNSQMPTWPNKRFLGWCIYLAILCALFSLRLREFASYTAHSDVHSYVLLVPFVTAYLLYIRWRQLSGEFTTSWGPAAVLTAVGVGALFAGRHFSNRGQNDHMKNEGPGGERVPDNGATVMLLGGALAGLGLVRHYLKR